MERGKPWRPLLNGLKLGLTEIRKRVAAGKSGISHGRKPIDTLKC
jgi:hypothetical protein